MNTNYSMKDYFKIATLDISRDLVSPEALSSIQSIAQLLPPLSLAGFECRLGATQPRVDFQVNLRRLPLNLPPQFSTHSVWQFFQNFCQEWTKPSSLYQEVEDIHLEFDLDGRQLPEPLPCIFLKFGRETKIGSRKLVKITQRLFESGTSPLLESNLRQCANSLPTGATISHIGAMLSRSNKAVRINVKGIAPKQLPDYLKQVTESDTTDEFSALTSTLSGFVDNILLSFDVGDTILPRIGLECFIDKQPCDNAPRWQAFLDYLVKQGLCTPAKKDAVLDWPKLYQKSSVPDLWPSNISWGDRFLGSRAVSVLWRDISHIKLVYQPGSALEAKGYLAFGHDWFDPSLLVKKTQSQNKQDSEHKLLRSN